MVVVWEAARGAFAAVFDSFVPAHRGEARHRVFGNTGLSFWRLTARKTDDQTIDVRGCDVFTFDGA